jgi:hypothetical protein
MHHACILEYIAETRAIQQTLAFGHHRSPSNAYKDLHVSCPYSCKHMVKMFDGCHKIIRLRLSLRLILVWVSRQYIYRLCWCALCHANRLVAMKDKREVDRTTKMVEKLTVGGWHLMTSTSKCICGEEYRVEQVKTMVEMDVLEDLVIGWWLMLRLW